jgi:hypothetical protein
MNRQESFEKAYADAHGLPLETFEQYRMGDTYRLPMIAKCWRFYCSGYTQANFERTAHVSVTVNPIDFADVRDQLQTSIQTRMEKP